MEKEFLRRKGGGGTLLRGGSMNDWFPFYTGVVDVGKAFKGKAKGWNKPNVVFLRLTPFDAVQLVTAMRDAGIGEVTKSKPLTFRRHTDTGRNHKVSA